MPKQEQSRDNRSGSSGKIGLNSDDQPDLVEPSGVNARDHGVAGDAPSAGGTLNFDDGDVARPYGNTGRTGGTWDDKHPSDAGELAPPGAGLSDNNGPSDPDNNKKTR